MSKEINGLQFKQMILHAAAAIARQKQAINDLNVFPVPDGDTGTNMSMTIATAAAELRRSSPEAVGQAASVTASALLQGARGNSGVILSLLFRGVSKRLKGCATADAATLAAAMQEGVAAAYKAVMKPAEGTVLTVSRLLAKRAAEAAADGSDIEAMLEAALEEGYDALSKTTEMNPVLKKAGVVDAGGKGYLLIVEGMLAALRGEPLPQAEEDAAGTEKKADFNAGLTLDEITFTFDTVYVVRKTREDVDLMPLRAYLSSIGDSLVIGEDDETFKVHVHTDIPGKALTESQKYGTLELAKIENMRSQAEALAAGREAQSTDDLDAVESALEGMEDGAGTPAEPEKPVGFLAICAGDGLADVFRDLGCDGVVSGGQTMNPSTESILAGIRRIPAETVFVLPNNSNIIMAAQQCQGLTEKNVVVIPSKTVPQGITAMMSADTGADVPAITEAMTQALSAVSTAQITYAARDSDFDGFDIHQGDYLALKDGKLFGTDKRLPALMESLAQEGKDASFIALYYGEDVGEADAEAMGEVYRAACPQAEVSVLRGGQPVYYYIVSFEA